MNVAKYLIQLYTIILVLGYPSDLMWHSCVHSLFVFRVQRIWIFKMMSWPPVVQVLAYAPLGSPAKMESFMKARLQRFIASEQPMLRR